MPELDSLRGIAILLVLFFHGFGFEYGTTGLAGIPRWFVAATLPGWAGVNLFFVLSGFLITGILLDSKGKPSYYRRFYARRALRILPAYYALLLILCIVPVTGLFAHRNISWRFITLSAIYLANVTTFFGVRTQYAALWSLAVEEHFYLLWPTIIHRLSRRAVAICALAVMLICPVLRGIASHFGYATGGYTWLVADGLALGALLAVAARAPWPQRTTFKSTCLVVTIASLLLFLCGAPFGVLRGGNVVGAVLRPVALNLFFASMLLTALLAGTTRFRWMVNWAVLQFFGKISYGLYLIHLLAFDFVDHLALRYFPGVAVQGHFALMCLRFTVAAGLAVGVSYLSRIHFEERFLKLKDRVWAGGSQNSKSVVGSGPDSQLAASQNPQDIPAA